ncbi:Unknown protein [Striga hermonthica]|uniref:Uncharacterized protein n=1 Tax=Striga hermonthica TaxID=68872 RepID=A0A9N7RI24_STRHE|nr:Unknown protein [Striga hermonthica]
MSITKSIITCGFSRGLVFDPSCAPRPRVFSCYSSNFTAFHGRDRSLLWGNGSMRAKGNKDTRRVLVRSIVEPGAPPPTEPPFNFINWIVGITITVVLPFITHKWASLLKFKNEIETAVETVEEIVEVVEKVAGEVEKAAEDIADDLPTDGQFRKVVDFVEHVAERANRDAHLVGDFIDKVQEVEEKVEDYVESLGDDDKHEISQNITHINKHKKDHQEKEGSYETLKEEN